MKKQERNQLLQRYTDLLNRLDDLNTIEENTTSLFDKDLRKTISSIIDETKLELSNLKDIKDKKREYIFNFKGGGWNTEWAFYEEEAIQQAITKYGNPETQESLRVDTKSFRISTPSDYNQQLSSFY